MVDTWLSSGYHVVVSVVEVLLEGNVEDIKAWGLGQADDEVSCREVLMGRSPLKARTFANVALKVVHGAVSQLLTVVEGQHRAYLIHHLHEAVTAAPVSPWVLVIDDARGAVALEIAQRCRSIPWLFRRDLTALPQLSVRARLEDAAGMGGGGQSEKPLTPSGAVLAFLEGAVLEDLATERLHDEYVAKLQRLRRGFGLSIEELRTLLSVSRTSIHKWLAGGGISPESRARIDENLAWVTQMESYWRPGLLPSIVRRHGLGLKGRTPLELILKGKSEDVIRYFDELTDYGATA